MVFGACLVKSEVFRKMEYPHFNYQSALNHRDTISEDVYFCKKARDNGFKVWADTTIICDHKGTHYYKLNQDVQVLDQPTNNTQQPEIAVLDTNTQKVFK